MNHKKDWSSFEFSPQGEVFSISSNGEILYYNFITNDFSIEQNPLGESNPKKIFNVIISEDFKKMTFDTIDNTNEIKTITLIAQHNTDVILYEVFFKAQQNHFKITEADLDRIEMSFQKGMLYELRIYKKDRKYNLIDSLTIFEENDKLYVLTRNPRSKLILKNLEVSNGHVVYDVDYSHFVYRLDIQETIINFLNKTIKESCNLFW
ncbi:hypothetical protein AGMMS50239_40660 [Bacteroidia bacterium]|nr:hypothetical protein AGMMS50239_40660 [Bacteroidia bacterium]